LAERRERLSGGLVTKPGAACAGLMGWSSVTRFKEKNKKGELGRENREKKKPGGIGRNIKGSDPTIIVEARGNNQRGKTKPIPRHGRENRRVGPKRVTS